MRDYLVYYVTPSFFLGKARIYAVRDFLMSLSIENTAAS